MSRRTLLLALGAAALAAGGALGFAQQREEDFPHERHANLFPLCTGCHEGVPEGDPARFYPPPAACAQCHNDRQAERVDWSGPRPEVTNLKFSHPGHDAELAREGRELECMECHGREGAGRMQGVRLAVVERCLACHPHQGRDHFADAPCATCHVPLAETRFALARVQALPEPPSHREPGFLAELHGDLAEREPERCATCHTRELCAGCHVNAARLAAIGAVPPAGGRVELPRFTAEYPVPASHLDPDWETGHGRRAEATSCAACHTRESCLACHRAPAPAAIARLPSRSETAAPGVALARRAPESHASAFFAVQHGAWAASRPESCATCHERAEFCLGCHEGALARADVRGARPASPAGARTVELASHAPPRRTGIASFASLAVHRAAADTTPRDTGRTPPREAWTGPAAPAGGEPGARPGERNPAREFHPPNYVARHAAAAYGQRLECSNCHNLRVFCRECHTQAGFRTQGRLGPGFHDAEPVWLLRHGQAARQTLESCATCHAQQDCLQCHSQTGSFRVNPHGPGFDARRAEQRNPNVCRVCHLGDPFGRTEE